MSRLLFMLPLLLSATAIQAGPEAVPLYREIRDWVVACDNLRSCQAIGVADFGYSPLRLVVSRDADPEAPPRVRLVYAGPTERFPLSSDGRPLPDTLANALHHEKGADESILSGEGEVVVGLLAEWRNARVLRLEEAAEEAEAVVSLSGLSAALLLMDSVQGRLDSRSALYRPGERDDGEVPAPPGPPQLHPFPGAVPLADAERRRIAEAVMAATRSEWEEPDMGSQAPEAEAYALTEREVLVLIRTWCAAYNCSFALYRVARAAPHPRRPLRLDPRPFGGDAFGGWLDYDEGTGQLGYFSKGRGLADCGSEVGWLFDGERFQLQSARLMQRCAGIPPDDWPELWRTVQPGQRQLSPK